MTTLDLILQNITKSHIYIQTHKFPDPDAIASAYALKRLLAQRDIAATICYTGKVDRFSTVKMIEELHIELFKVDDILDMTEKDEVILVDCQKGNVNIDAIKGNVIICIDHHPYNSINEYRFIDIQKSVGACASIIGNYFIENNIEIDKKLATALIYAIKIDTANLSRGVSQLDLDMFYYLYNRCDMDILNGLEHSVLQIEDLHAFANVINTISIAEGVSFASTGIECPEALIATISDFTMSIANVYLSVVYSIRSDGIKLSVRSKYSTCNAGKICKNALGGYGNGGGHAHMAGGFIPFTGDEKEAEKIIEKVKRNFLLFV